MDELLRSSAPLAAREAPRLCQRGELHCGWYHGVWQYLCLLGIVTTPRDHANFFVDAIAAKAIPKPARRVLICGAADYGLLIPVLGAFTRTSDAPAVTVLDICETPLMLNRWYAERVRAEIRTERSDILRYRSRQPVDVICTHCFLGNFTPRQRERLWKKWAELLAPGGTLITINRIRPDTAGATVAFDPAQIGAFRERVLQVAEQHREDLDIEPERLADLAREYAYRKRTYAVRSLEELADPIEKNGFTIDCMSELPPLAATPAGTALGPTVRASRSQYVKLIATRGGRFTRR